MEVLESGVWAVTGAAGRIGRHLRVHLRERFSELRAIDIVPIDDLGANETRLVADLRDQASMETALAGCTGVVHLGGIPDEADFHDLTESNIIGTYHLLEAARRNGLSRVVYASSNRITGFYPVGREVDPNMAVRPDGFYGVSKAAGEALCQLYADKFELSTISVRIGTYGQAPTNARQASTWLSYRDALRAFDAAIATDEHHCTFYAVSNNTDRWWSLDAGNKIGFAPKDNAADLISPAEGLRADSPQGGDYASVEFSLSRMRQQ